MMNIQEKPVIKKPSITLLTNGYKHRNCDECGKPTRGYKKNGLDVCYTHRDKTPRYGIVQKLIDEDWDFPNENRK